MPTFIVMMMIMATAGTTLAQDLGSSRGIPQKSTTSRTYISPEDGKQGGDTIDDATIIFSLPFSDSGTTDGYVNNYDESCPYSASVSPDVVYSFTPSQTTAISVDLCGSGYDTKTYIYNENLLSIICNDDFYYDDICGEYVSKIEYVELTGGELYYIVVDGYGGDSGFYELMVSEFTICHLDMADVSRILS